MKLIHNPLRYSNIEVQSHKTANVHNKGPISQHGDTLVFTMPNNSNIIDFLFELLIKNSDRFPKLVSIPTAIITRSAKPLLLSDSEDIFGYLRPSVLNALKNNKAILIFDTRTEGHSPAYFPILQRLYHSCKIHKVRTQNVVFLSSNLRDEQNNAYYAKLQSMAPIHVCSYLFFEKMLSTANTSVALRSNYDDKLPPGYVEQQYAYAINRSTSHTDKIFSSLSRINKNYRSVATFLLSHNDISNWCLISHNKFGRRQKANLLSGNNLDNEPSWNNFNPAEYPTKWRNFNKLFDYSDQQVLDWCDKLPLVIDQSDFNVNWALVPYQHLHDQTVFQIVNETMVDDHQQTSIFYSEKTFRPISCFQPFLIYGQPGCNRYLKELGYQLYDDWFDLSFDDVEDPVERYRQLLNAITPTVKMLEQMSAAERVSWRFKNPDVLKHNFQVMTRSQYSEDKLLNLFQNLENTLN